MIFGFNSKLIKLKPISVSNKNSQGSHHALNLKVFGELFAKPITLRNILPEIIDVNEFMIRKAESWEIMRSFSTQ